MHVCVWRGGGVNNVQISEGGEEASPRDILKYQRTGNVFQLVESPGLFKTGYPHLPSNSLNTHADLAFFISGETIQIEKKSQKVTLCFQLLNMKREDRVGSIAPYFKFYKLI